MRLIKFTYVQKLQTKIRDKTQRHMQKKKKKWKLGESPYDE